MFGTIWLTAPILDAVFVAQMRVLYVELWGGRENQHVIDDAMVDRGRTMTSVLTDMMKGARGVQKTISLRRGSVDEERKLGMFV